MTVACRYFGPTPPRRSSAGESAVLAALRWLARHQSPDGHWSAANFDRCCSVSTCGGAGDSDHEAGVTSLALLAYLGAGFSQYSREVTADPAVPGLPLDFGATVKKGLQWLIAQQDAEGCVGSRGPKHLYSHAISAVALSEAYGLTVSAALRAPAQRAIDFLVAAQNPGQGWRYTPRSGESDTSVTGWAVMALKSADLAGLQVPRTTFDGAIRWLDQVTDPGDFHRVGYTTIGSGKVFTPGANEGFADHPTLTAVDLLSRIFIEKVRRVPARTQARLLAQDPPAWQPGCVDFYYWYYGSLALFQLDGPGGSLWTSWNESLKDAVILHQQTVNHACANGSWNPVYDRWGSEGGRVYATAMNALSLEIYSSPGPTPPPR